MILEKPNLKHLSQAAFFEDPLKYIEDKFEEKEIIDQWAFKWSHRIIEEVFVRPELDVKKILAILKEHEIGDALPTVSLKTTHSTSSAFNEDTRRLTKSLKSKKSE